MNLKNVTFIILLSIGISATAQVNLTNGLVGCYPFSGNADDMSGNGHHGTVNGSALTSDRFGNADDAYSFDGSDDYIDISGMSLPDKEISISFWAKTNQFKSQTAFSAISDDLSDRLVIQISYNHNGDTATFWDFGNINYDGRLGDYPLASMVWEWEHYVFISSSSKDSMLIYRDGTLKKGVNYSDSLDNTNRTLRIGSGDNKSYFNGSIDNVRIYNRAITKSEVEALYNGAGCNETSTGNTSFETPEEEAVRFFPNPFTHQTSLVFDNSTHEPYTLKLYNATGQLVYSKRNISTEQFTLSRNNLNNGIYFYRLANNKNEVTGKGKLLLK